MIPRPCPEIKRDDAPVADASKYVEDVEREYRREQIRFWSVLIVGVLLIVGVAIGVGVWLDNADIEYKSQFEYRYTRADGVEGRSDQCRPSTKISPGLTCEVENGYVEVMEYHKVRRSNGN